MKQVLYYVPPSLPIADVRALGSASMVRAEHRSHLMDLAAWLGELEERTGRTIGTLLASEQRQYDKRLKAIRELDELREPTMTPAEALAQLEGLDHA